jgi:hypothetical protein
MTALPARRPFLPEDRDRYRRSAEPLVRAVLAHARAEFEPGGVTHVARHLFPDDRATLELIERAATVPADTVTSGWASQLAAQSVSDLFTTLGGASASGQIFKRALNVTFGRSASVIVPTVISGTDVAFVGQGSPIPVRQLSVSGPTLTPKKVAVIFVLTRETIEHTDAERIVGAVLRESTGITVDSIMLDAGAGTTVRPAGLRNGVAATTASTINATADIFSPMVEDLGNLAAAVAGVGGTDVIFVAGPGAGAKILAHYPAFKFPVFISSGLANNILMAIAPTALAIAADETPRIESAREGLVHMEDTTPLAIGTTGAPNTVAAPVRSLWQTDTIGIRLIFNVTWAPRATGTVAWLTTNW